MVELLKTVKRILVGWWPNIYRILSIFLSEFLQETKQIGTDIIKEFLGKF